MRWLFHTQTQIPKIQNKHKYPKYPKYKGNSVVEDAGGVDVYARDRKCVCERGRAYVCESVYVCDLCERDSADVCERDRMCVCVCVCVCVFVYGIN